MLLAASCLPRRGHAAHGLDRRLPRGRAALPGPRGGLQRAGHQVTLATHRPIEPDARRLGLGFAPTEGNPRQVLETEQGCVAGGRPPSAPTPGIMRFPQPHDPDGSPWRVARPQQCGRAPTSWPACATSPSALSRAGPTNLAAAYAITPATLPAPWPPSGSPSDEPDITRERRSPGWRTATKRSASTRKRRK